MTLASSKMELRAHTHTHTHTHTHIDHNDTMYINNENWADQVTHQICKNNNLPIVFQIVPKTGLHLVCVCVCVYACMCVHNMSINNLTWAVIMLRINMQNQFLLHIWSVIFFLLHIWSVFSHTSCILFSHVFGVTWSAIFILCVPWYSLLVYTH